MTDAFESVTDAIRRRRSFKPAAMDPDRDVPRDVVLALLDNARWAPTHGMTEPWRFKIFTGQARARLAATLPGVYDLVTPADQVRPDKREKLGVIFTQAPVVIAIIMTPDPRGKIIEIEEIEAVACAVQNLHLSACAAGLAAMWSTPPLVYSAEVKPALGLSEHDRCLGFFFLGWPAAGTSWPEASRRLPLADVIEWIDV